MKRRYIWALLIAAQACGDDATATDAATGDTMVSDAPASDAPTSDAPSIDAPISDAPGDARMLDAPMDAGDDALVDAGPDVPVVDAGFDGGFCVDDTECDDGAYCNGPERCDPSSPTADSRGCASMSELPCPPDRCSETDDTCFAATICPDVCRTDAECTSFCNGSGTCDPGNTRSDERGCVPGTRPCSIAQCNEAARVCCSDAAGCCTSAIECDDGVASNGSERCAPGAAGANGRGCVPGTPVSACSLNSDCDDGRWCNGFEACNPSHPRANSRGCVSVAGTGSICILADCDEGRDCCLSRTGSCLGPTVGNPCASLSDNFSDVDGDGSDAIRCGGGDCDDNDANRYPGNVEVCDFAGHDEDCNPATLGRRDVDGDGVTSNQCCYNTRTSRVCGADCDDGQRTVRPGAAEVCNERDDDCDGATDERVRVLAYLDNDGDGQGGVCARQLCLGTPDYVAVDGDCHDNNPALRNGSQTCGGSRDEVLVCVSGEFIANDCPAGTECQLQPSGVGDCR